MKKITLVLLLVLGACKLPQNTAEAPKKDDLSVSKYYVSGLASQEVKEIRSAIQEKKAGHEVYLDWQAKNLSDSHAIEMA